MVWTLLFQAGMYNRIAIAITLFSIAAVEVFAQVPLNFDQKVAVMQTMAALQDQETFYLVEVAKTGETLKDHLNDFKDSKGNSPRDIQRQKQAMANVRNDLAFMAKQKTEADKIAQKISAYASQVAQ